MTTLRVLLFTVVIAAGIPVAAQAQTATLVPPNDPIWNGALIGAWAFTRYNCGPPGNDSECAAIAGLAGTVTFIPAGALAGAFIDWLIRPNRPRPLQGTRWFVAPVFGKKQIGVSASITGWGQAKSKKARRCR